MSYTTSAPAEGFSHQIRAGTDLINWNLPVAEITEPEAMALHAGMPASSPGWTYRSFQITTPNLQSAFFQTVISTAP